MIDFSQIIMNLLEPRVILMLLVGVLGGIVAGALPGLTATMSVATLLPFTFVLPPAQGILLMCGIYFGAIYGGSISAILLGIPGTPAAAVTAFDGYTMAKKGNASKALSIAVISSCIGGLLSVAALSTIAPLLAKFALKFDAPEYFAVAVLGLSIIANVSGKSILKGAIAGLFGLLLATVGLDPVTAIPRLTMNSVKLLNGIAVIPALVGLFAISEVFSLIKSEVKAKKSISVGGDKLKFKEFISLLPTMVRSALTGIIIGAIPATGADVAAFVSYDQAKRVSKNPQKFGTGYPVGIAAAEAANNGTTGSTFIPLLTLGIPGDGVTAIMLGGFLIHGLFPGPLLFKENASLIYTLFLGMVIANLLLLFYGLVGAKYFALVTKMPSNLLVPIIAALSVVGAYGVNNSIFDVGLCIMFGVIGYFMKQIEMPLSPIILGLILGPMAETNFRRSLLLYDGYSFLWARPITALILILAIVSIAWGVRSSRKTVEGEVYSF